MKKKVYFCTMNDDIRQIWFKHIEVQEQLLQARAMPIPVNTASLQVTGDKLFLSVDENSRTDSILAQIANTFGIQEEELNISDGYFFVSADKSDSVSYSNRKTLSETAEVNHVKFYPNPIIDGVIKRKNASLIGILKDKKCDYSFDKKERLQISITDLKSIISELEKNEIIIPPTASVIFHFTPTPLFFLKQQMPNIPWQHRTTFSKNKREGKDIISKDCILIKNGYLSDEVVQKLYGQMGLSLYGYTITFRVKESILSEYNLPIDDLPKVNEDGCSFSFYTRIRQEKSVDDLNGCFEEQSDYILRFTRLKRLFDNKFGRDNVSFESLFEYRYDYQKFTTYFIQNQTDWEEAFWNELLQSLTPNDISINRNYEIGVDFNWEEESLIDVLTRVSSSCPYIALSYYDNHRCKIDLKFQNTSLKEIEKRIRDSFPSMQFSNNEKQGTLYFFQGYSDRTKRNQIARSLNDELIQLNLQDYSYEIYPINPEQVKYHLTIDKDALQESQSDAVNDLRGCDFIYGDLSIGKLIRVNYPQLTFDISSSEKEKIAYLVNEKLIAHITPDLTGDLEKIARLRTSFEAITSGNNLVNPDLSEFIFDATKAKKIDDVECYLDPKSDFYNDLNNNLLNKKVNESQKQAIIKTLLSNDLAIIQGPPGTGKSTAIAEIMWQHIRKNSQEKILLTSETNLAVDNAIARIINPSHNLVKPIRIGGEEKLEMEGKQFNVDTMRAWVEKGAVTYSEDDEDYTENEPNHNTKQNIILENWLANISRRIDENQLDESTYPLWKNILQNPTKETRQIVFDLYKNNCNVIGATCSSIGEKSTKGYPTSFFRTYCELFGKVEYRTSKEGKGYTKYLGKIKFDTVIQDESSKATPAELSLPLIYGKKNIIIGDHRQLPPLLDKEEFLSSLNYLLLNTEDEKQAFEIKKLQKYVKEHFRELEISHFQRLFESIDNSLKGVFNQQYRMHPAINEVIKQFYVEDGGLYCGLDEKEVESQNITNPQSRYHGINIDGFISPEDHVIWIDTQTPEMLVGTSRVNYGEVDAIRHILEKLQDSKSFETYQSIWQNDEDKQIGLISFYGKQLKLLKELRRDFKDIPIRISTVDRFQGMERNIIIVSMVRSNRIALDKNQQADFGLYPDLGYEAQSDLGFAQSPNRLNVALSRAKRLLIIVGNSELFRSKTIYDNVFTCIKNSPNGKIIKAESL